SPRWYHPARQTSACTSARTRRGITEARQPMIDVVYNSPQDAPRNLIDNEPREYDALLIVSFGGPEGMDDVSRFLENVLRGRNIPRARLEEVGEHYRLFNGVSPINAQNRALIA